MKLDILKYDPEKDFLDYYNSKKTTLDFWTDCHRGDWMLFFAESIGVDKRKLVLAASLCAKTVEHLMKDERCINNVNAGIKYGKGEIQEEELKKYRKEACDAFYDIKNSISASSACNSSYAATNYNYSINISISASASASASAYFVFYFNVASDLGFSFSNANDFSIRKKKENQLKTANICREILTDEILKHLKQTNMKHDLEKESLERLKDLDKKLEVLDEKITIIKLEVLEKKITVINIRIRVIILFIIFIFLFFSSLLSITS